MNDRYVIKMEDSTFISDETLFFEDFKKKYKDIEFEFCSQYETKNILPYFFKSKNKKKFILIEVFEAYVVFSCDMSMGFFSYCKDEDYQFNEENLLLCLE